jgi:two-component system, chemotaxis family, chemotaxis protein CheY
VANILVIEDNAAIRELFRRRLEKAGHCVLDAPDGDEGITLYRQSRTDLIITDMMMPGKGGAETIAELREDFPDARIIAVSGIAETIASPSCGDSAVRLGVERVFQKPIQWPALFQAIHELVDTHDADACSTSKVNGAN